MASSYLFEEPFWGVSSCLWGSHEPAKVVISLRTSFKNQVSKKCLCKTPFKALLRGFWTMLSPQNDPYWVSRGVTDQWFSSFSRRWMPRVVHIPPPTLGKGNFYTLLYRYCSVFDPNHGKCWHENILLSCEIDVRSNMNGSYCLLHVSHSIMFLINKQRHNPVWHWQQGSNENQSMPISSTDEASKLDALNESRLHP